MPVSKELVGPVHDPLVGPVGTPEKPTRRAVPKAEKPDPAVRENQEPGKEAERDPMDEAGDESFPASDPPAYTPLHAGTPTR